MSAVEGMAFNPPLVEGAPESAVLSPEWHGPEAFSVPQTPGGALSIHSSGGSRGPDMAPLNDLVGSMKGTLDHLGGVFDSLGEHTARVASIAPALQAAHQIKQLKRQLVVQDQRQEERVQNLKVLLRDVLKAQIGDHLRHHVHLIIQEKVKERVAAHVENQLNKQFPPALREQVARHKRQLQGVKQSLWDSNARRQNAILKDHQLEEPLQPLMKPDGGISWIFPKRLADLFSLDAKEALQLCQEYDLPVGT
ncbi:hypothetical protein DL93DRAFT_1833567 [Clavulina sp. PMI_390]|nr:hypothetical protein DL93DRAFT_1833567 [Clavulina sp. PMI_390]